MFPSVQENIATTRKSLVEALAYYERALFYYDGHYSSGLEGKSIDEEIKSFLQSSELSSAKPDEFENVDISAFHSHSVSLRAFDDGIEYLEQISPRNKAEQQENLNSYLSVVNCTDIANLYNDSIFIFSYRLIKVDREYGSLVSIPRVFQHRFLRAGYSLLFGVRNTDRKRKPSEDSLHTIKRNASETLERIFTEAGADAKVSRWRDFEGYWRTTQGRCQLLMDEIDFLSKRVSEIQNMRFAKIAVFLGLLAILTPPLITHFDSLLDFVKKTESWLGSVFTRLDKNLGGKSDRLWFWLVALMISFGIIGFKPQLTVAKYRWKHFIAGLWFFAISFVCSLSFIDATVGPEKYMRDFMVIVGTVFGGGFLLRGFDKEIIKK